MRRGNYNPLKLKTPNADTLSLRLITKGSKVLELGCSTGYLGKVMKKDLYCKVIGVEINSKMAKRAATFLDKVIDGDIEDEKVLLQIKKEGPYDVVFASAILEHLVYPKKILKKLTPLLKKSGYFVITLPNIAHYTARFSILAGNFNYQDAGLFDKTHLHFYTLSTARELLTAVGLKITQEDYEFFGPKPLSILFRHLPTLFAYQIVLEAHSRKFYANH